MKDLFAQDQGVTPFGGRSAALRAEPATQSRRYRAAAANAGRVYGSTSFRSIGRNLDLAEKAVGSGWPIRRAGEGVA